MEFEKLINRLERPVRVEGVGEVLAPRRKTPVTYRSRKNGGKARVLGGYERETGAWVVLHDKERDAVVTVRPSQVTAL